MQPFRVHTGKTVPLERNNIDTDQIIPKQFLKRIERAGYGEFLFYSWRYTTDGNPNPEFILNEPRFSAASILLTGRNFGCGSSREHAAWALLDYGFCAIIAPRFADIFAMNCAKNGILTVTLEESQVAELTHRALTQADYAVTINLEMTEIRDSLGYCSKFSIEPERRKFLLEGLDDIGQTLKQLGAIAAFEKSRRACLSPTSLKHI